MKALERAIDAIGTQTALAESLGLHRMAISQWKKRGVPAKYFFAIESATEGAVTCEEFLEEFYSNRE